MSGCHAGELSCLPDWSARRRPAGPEPHDRPGALRMPSVEVDLDGDPDRADRRIGDDPVADDRAANPKPVRDDGAGALARLLRPVLAERRRAAWTRRATRPKRTRPKRRDWHAPGPSGTRDRCCSDRGVGVTGPRRWRRERQGPEGLHLRRSRERRARGGLGVRPAARRGRAPPPPRQPSTRRCARPPRAGRRRTRSRSWGRSLAAARDPLAPAAESCWGHHARRRARTPTRTGGPRRCPCAREALPTLTRLKQRGTREAGAPGGVNEAMARAARAVVVTGGLTARRARVSSSGG